MDRISILLKAFLSGWGWGAEDKYDRWTNFIWIIDTCQGDSGGPLMYFDSNRRWVLAGLTSAGADCASLEYSAIYTRVLTFTNWINSYVNPSLITTTRTSVGITTAITSRPLITNTTMFNHPKYLNYLILMIVNLILQLLFWKIFYRFSMTIALSEIENHFITSTRH